MTIGIMQPYFMPYIGYFQLMKAVDKYIIYDDVNYIKGGWTNRNNILINGEKRMFTVTLKEASPNKLFNEIEIKDDFRKLIKTLQMSYSKSANFKEAMSLMEGIISFPNKRFTEFIVNCFQEILNYLSIDTELILSSNIHKDNALKGKEKVLHICNILGGNTYYNAIGGEELYSKEEFKENGIMLNFIETIIQPYPQPRTHDFVPNLSMIDILMNNSKENINALLDSFILR